MAVEVNVKFTEKQARIVMQALNIYFRTSMGQFVDLAEHVLPKENFIDRFEIERQIKSILFPKLTQGGYYSISNPQVPDESRIACNIYDVLRNRLAHFKLNGKAPDKSSVIYDNPYTKGSDPMKLEDVVVLEKE
jgi:hypothetical protein